MIFTIAKVADFDQFLETFSTRASRRGSSTGAKAPTCSGIPMIQVADAPFARAVLTRDRRPVAAVDVPSTALYRDGRLWTHDEPADHWFTELAGPRWSQVEPPVLMATLTRSVVRRTLPLPVGPPNLTA